MSDAKFSDLAQKLTGNQLEAELVYLELAGEQATYSGTQVASPRVNVAPEPERVAFNSGEIVGKKRNLRQKRNNSTQQSSLSNNNNPARITAQQGGTRTILDSQQQHDARNRVSNLIFNPRFCLPISIFIYDKQSLSQSWVVGTLVHVFCCLYANFIYMHQTWTEWLPLERVFTWIT